MRLKCLALILTCLLSCKSSEVNFPIQSKFDITGLSQFWKIQDYLKTGNEPEKQEWEKLFATKGYESLMKTYGRSIEKMKKEWRYAFMPKYAGKRDSLLKSKQRAKVYQNLLENRTYYQNLVNSLIDNENSILQEVTKLCKEWLPDDFEVRIPSIYLLAFGENNGFAYDNHILIDLTVIENLNRFKLTMAHELHHHVLQEFQCPDIDLMYEQEGQFAWLLQQLPREGIADQINRKGFLTDPLDSLPSYAKSFRTHYAKSNEMIVEFDSTFIGFLKNDPDTLKTYNWYRILVRGGHPAGYHMANLIKEVLGEDLLKNDVNRNGFKFFYLYNEAVKKSGKDLVVLSDTTIDYFKKMEKKYCAKI